jgi:hypothetical protein
VKYELGFYIPEDDILQLHLQVCIATSSLRQIAFPSYACCLVLLGFLGLIFDPDMFLRNVD